MIQVKRTRVTKPAALDGPNSKGERERVRNATRVATSATPSLTFTAYKDKEVVERLEELFSRKCAYCESKYAGIHPVDVEHFRPKAVVFHSRGGPGMAGYWWLAAAWENLFPSCIDCNRARYHEHTQGNVAGRAKRGKENLFPIRGPVCAAHAPGCEAGEARLLLDPCVDDPSLVLTWTDDGVVLPTIDPATGAPHEMAQPSIECYGLDRNDLFLLRHARAVEVRAAIVRIKEAEARCKQYPNDPTFAANVATEAATLRRYIRDDEPYAAMARELVRRHYRPI
jgi:uncharacterized protein (TIGR02646 family)